MAGNEMAAMEADGVGETLSVYEAAAETLLDMGDESKVIPDYAPRYRPGKTVPAIRTDGEGPMVGWAIAKAYFVNAFENKDDDDVTFEDILDVFDEVYEQIPTLSDSFGYRTLWYK